MPYFQVYSDKHYDLPRYVHVTKDHIRIDERVINYKGVTKSQLEWIRQQWQGWAANPCHENNKEWAEAIITELQDRLCEFMENARLDAESLTMEVPDYDLSTIFPAQCFKFRWRLSL